MRIATWNIRGLGSAEKKVVVKRLLKEEHIDLIGLVETKHKDITIWDVRKLWGLQNAEWVHSPAVNGSGGLVVTWNSDSFKEISSMVTQRWVYIFGKFLKENFACAVCVIYAPNNQRDRLELWNNLREFRQQLTSPLLLMGDLNEVMFMEERRNATQVTTGMIELRDWIQDMQLCDLPINQQFTWMRDNAASRLDRIMVTSEFIEKFQNMTVKCKERVLSDHFPLVLSTSEISWGPSPFRTLDGWLEEPKFMQIFQEEWIQLASMPFEQKIKAMKRPLRRWNKEVFGFVDDKITVIQSELSKLDAKEQGQPPIPADIYRRKALQAQMWLWIARKERFWKQMSRCKILNEGDRNTKYFHLIATMRRKKQMIEKVVVEGQEYTEMGSIRKAIVQHFKSHYSRKEVSRFDIRNLGLSRLSEELSQGLSEEVTKE